jgi:hypothetical protein
MPTLKSLLRYSLPNAAGFVRYPSKLVPTQKQVDARGIGVPDRKIALTERQVQPLLLDNAFIDDQGILLQGHKAYAHGSSTTPTPGFLTKAHWQRLRNRQRTPSLNTAILLGMQHPNTYGDWFRQGLLLMCINKIDRPILLPSDIYNKSYVQRDAKRLGVSLRPIPTGGTFINNAKALYLGSGFNEWHSREAEAIRKAFQVAPPAPIPGSILYLSRLGETNPSCNRHYPSLIVEEFIQSLGGKVVRAKDTSFDDYLKLAPYVETVIADHGSAQCNLTWWRTRRVIELHTTHYNDFFLSLGAALGINEYVILKANDLSADQLRSRLKKALEMSFEPSSPV